jgi:hypothetical protein
MTTRSSQAGRRKYNRFYLPTMVVQATDGNGLMGVLETDAFVLWLNLNITSHEASGTLPVAMVNHNAGSPSTNHQILDIYVGRRLDVIRRRANRQPEPRVIDTI